MSGEARTSILELTCEKSSRVLRGGGGTRSRETTRMLLSLPVPVKENVDVAANPGPGFLLDLRGGVGVAWSFPVAMLIE